MIKTKKGPHLVEISKLIKNWKISQPVLAEKIQMPLGTFKNKLNLKQVDYFFSQPEFTKLCSVLIDLVLEIPVAIKTCNRISDENPSTQKSKILS